jgi:hypothetical protein
MDSEINKMRQQKITTVMLVPLSGSSLGSTISSMLRGRKRFEALAQGHVVHSTSRR